MRSRDRAASTHRVRGHSLYAQGPYRDGTTHVMFEPMDFLARLAALVPLPRVHLTRFHGVYAPRSRLRASITPAGRGRPRREGQGDKTAVQKHLAMTWIPRAAALEEKTDRSRTPISEKWLAPTCFVRSRAFLSACA